LDGIHVPIQLTGWLLVEALLLLIGLTQIFFVKLVFDRQGGDQSSFRQSAQFSMWCCGSIPYSVEYPGCLSRIPDLGSNTSNKREGGKTLIKIKNYFIYFFTKYRKKCEPIDKELEYFLPKKLSLTSQLKNMGWETRDPEKPIPNPGVKKVQIRNTRSK
jgi:hypothetical protein